MPRKSKIIISNETREKLWSALEKFFPHCLELVTIVKCDAFDAKKLNTATILFRRIDDKLPVLKDMSKTVLSLALERIFVGDFPQFSNARKQTVSSTGEQWKPKQTINDNSKFEWIAEGEKYWFGSKIQARISVCEIKLQEFKKNQKSWILVNESTGLVVSVYQACIHSNPTKTVFDSQIGHCRARRPGYFSKNSNARNSPFFEHQVEFSKHAKSLEQLAHIQYHEDHWQGLMVSMIYIIFILNVVFWCSTNACLTSN